MILSKSNQISSSYDAVGTESELKDANTTEASSDIQCLGGLSGK